MERSDETFRTVARLPSSELAAFEAVTRHGGYRAAARVTGVSASALSHAVAGLERRLGTQLLFRSTRHVSTTDAGQRFLALLQPALEQIGQAVAELETSVEEPRGLIRINASPAAVEQIMVPVLSRFMATAPQVRMEISGEGALVDIAKDGYDCGIRLHEMVPADMIAIPIGPSTQQHIVVASPSYLSRATEITSPGDLATQECIQLRLSKDHLYRWEFTENERSFSIQTSGRMEVDSTRLALLAAEAGLGCAYVTRWLAEEALQQGRVVQLLDAWTPPYPGLSLYYIRNRNLGAAMREFVSFLRKEGRTER